MKDSTVITCDKVFMDPSGTDIIPQNIYYNIRTTFKPAIAGNNVKISFSKFKISGSLYVYNGSSTSSPQIGYYNSSSTTLPVFDGTGTEGSLTFVYQGYSYGDTGWVAQVSCYKPVAKPTGLRATADALVPRLTWNDNANDETGYVIERSVNTPSKYTFAAQMPANTNQFIDSAAPANSLIYYRVKAYRDTINSFYSDTAVTAFGNAPFLMKDSTLITCDKVFMDPSGTDVLPSSGYYNTRATFKPAIAGNNIKVTFSKFRLSGYLYVYNGPTTNSPQIGYYTGYYPSLSFDGIGADGSLTFVYQGYSYSDTGWVAQVSCYKPVAKPSTLRVSADTLVTRLTWNDNANDETRYVVERSVNAPAKYIPISVLPANANQYIDSTAPANSLLYYRVRAYRDTLGSFYSDTAIAAFGNAPFLMKDSTLITCDKVFMDPYGTDVLPSNGYFNTRTTFKPGIAGNNIKVSFSKFRLSGYLYVYNGPTTSSPQIGYYYGYYPSLSFDGTGADGSLTFAYQGSSYSDSGWVAQVSCYKPVAKPSGLRVTPDTLVTRLSWNDNANDETRYVVERSVNAPSKYLPISTLAANASQYIDSTAPINSQLFYRVRAYRDTLGSFFSDTASVAFGNAPFLMKDSTLITCNKIFMDPGGTDVLLSNNIYNNIRTTFKPSVAGNNVKVTFSKFMLSGSLYVYNGSSTSSPQIGYYNGIITNMPVFDGLNSEGALTFVYQGYFAGDSGWVAQVNCYKPISKPTGMRATVDTDQRIKLNWNDNANDETKYVLERSVNAPTKYLPVVQLPANTNQYTDSSAPANSLLFYRVKAYRDTLGSFYSDTATVSLGNAPFIMKDSTLITCDKVFLDQGGVDVIPSGVYFNNRTTFKPAISGNRIKVVFSNYRSYVTLYAYNGPTTGSPQIGVLYGYSNNSTVFEGTGSDGSLTFLTSGTSYGDSGWVAQVSCYKPVAKPTGATAIADASQRVNLTWIDNADDETKYTVERSVNAPSKYIAIAQLSSNANQFTDSTAPANSFLFYRVRAYRDTLGSYYSDTAKAGVGNAPFLMKDSTLITCEKVFMDPGGADIIPANTYYNLRTTFKPAVAGNAVRVAFSKFNISGNFYVYNGPSTNSPLIGTYGGNVASLSFTGTGTDGSLTFQYNGYSYGDSGWVAQVNCYRTTGKPTNLTAYADALKDVHLSWTDNAADETGFVLERSINDSLHYVPLVTLPANNNNYLDTSAPDNSFVFYRVKAIFNETISDYSNNISVNIGNVYIMQNGTVNGCGALFLDPGGFGNYNNNLNYITTFMPSETGKKIRIAFSEFNTESCCDALSIYNGPSTSYPLLGSYRGTTIPPVLQSSATNGELTFVFYADGSQTGTGWVSNISCVTQNDTLSTCSLISTDINTLNSTLTGSTYQWQKYNGAAFVNIYTDANTTGTSTASLQVKNAGLTVFEKFRCLVNGTSYSRELVIIKGNRWKGTVSTDWYNAQNWSCGTVPNATTDILIEGGMTNTPVLNSNAECRSVMLMPGANLRIASGYTLYIRH